MKKIFLSVMIVVAIILLGCGGEKNAGNPTPPKKADIVSDSQAKVTEKTIYASSERSCTCIVNAEDIDDFIAAAKRKDLAFIKDMSVSGRTFVIKNNTRVLCSDSGIYKDIVFVTFLEGEHEGKSAYVPASRVK